MLKTPSENLEESERFLLKMASVNESYCWIIARKLLGFVEFEDVRDAEDAIHEMNGERLCGDRITVELAKGKQVLSICS